MSKRHAVQEYQKVKPKVNQGSLKLRPVLEGKTPGQKRYMQAIKRSDITLCEGMVGTGKTFIAVGMAACDVLDRNSGREKVYIARPIVQAGEDIGFLPGAIQEKVDPYMIPIYEALHDFCRDEAEYRSAVESGTIELAPIGFMQGRSFKNCWVIIDEAQNATRPQLEIILGRLGTNCKLIICGSSQQCFIGKPDGWNFILDRLHGGGYQHGHIEVVRLGREDIVRHGLIGEIMDRLYDENPDEPVPDAKVFYEHDGLGSRYGLEKEADDDIDWLDSKESSGWCAS